MERGYIRVRAADGSYPYEQFEIDAGNDVFLTLTQTVDGTASALDVSASSVVVRLRAKVATAATVPIDLVMTKRTGTVTAGDTGKVSTRVTLRAASFTAGDNGLMGAYIVDTSTVDTLTPSGYAEQLWAGLWQFKVLGAIDS